MKLRGARRNWTNAIARLPALGLGVLRSSGEETAAAVETAIDAGYRLIDTAAGYLNEREAGQVPGIAKLPQDRASVAYRSWTLDDPEASSEGTNVAGIDAFDTGCRSGPDPEVFEASMYPVTIED